MSFVYSHPFTGLANGLQTMNGATGPVGGWVELGRTTLGSAGDTISVSSLSDKRYYMILYDLGADSTTNINAKLRFNGDTGSNYAWRYSVSGGADVTGTSQTDIGLWNSLDEQPVSLGVGYIANKSANEKLYLGHYYSPQTAGAATEGNRQESVGKWTNTSDAIDQIDVINTQSGSYDSGSELVVLGWDPDDTHTNNFWEELASVTATGSSGNLSSGTISAKKYLWVQWFVEPASSSVCRLTCNNDTSTNYSYRYSLDGGSDLTSTSVANLPPQFTTTTPMFTNMFIVNNATEEKLFMSHTVSQETAGAGNAPRRVEFVGKWANTSNQITEIDLDTSTGNWNSNSILKVWGAD